MFQQTARSSQHRPQHRPMPQGARVPGPAAGRLAATAARLNRAAPVQRLERSPLAAPLARGTLRAGQVQMQPLRQDLPAREVASLAARTRGISDRGQRPLARAVAEGRAQLGDTGVQLAPIAPAATGAGLAQSVAALDPRAVQLSVEGNRYSLRARLNPWIEVIGGVIHNVDTVTKWNQHKGGSWTFVTAPNFKKAGYTAHTALGQPWPPGGGGGGGYTVPSGTFDPSAHTPAFHALPPDRLPSVPHGYAWNQLGGEWNAFRDPVVVPSSPHYDVDEDVGGSGDLIYWSSIDDPHAASGRRPLSGHTTISTSTYKGPRDYPITSHDYTDAHGTVWGRSHIADHADGTAATTGWSGNYTPGDQVWNEGARNHLVRRARGGGGGDYEERFDYGPAPQRTNDGTPIPLVNHFAISDSGGGQQYYAVDNYNYGTSRSLAQVTPFAQPWGNRPTPPWF